MKKITYKIVFSIFMVVVILSQAIIAIPVNNKDNEPQKTTLYKWDLSLSFHSCKYSGIEAGILNDYAIYTLEYTITNVGSKRYIGLCDVIILIDDPDILPYRRWFEGLNLLPDESAPLSHEIKVITNPDPLIDEERGIAGHLVIMIIEMQELYDGNLINNIRFKTAEYWIEGEDYEPTEPQIDISEPGNITKQGLINPPYVLRMRERLGWKYELAERRADLWALRLNITYARLKVLGVPLVLWNKTLEFLKAIAGPDEIGWGELLILLLEAIDALGEIIDIVLNDPILAALNEYDRVHKEFKIWWNQKHWNFDISIRGSIFNCKPYEKITVRCRGESATFTADQYGIVETYEIKTIPCEYYNNEINWIRHKCIITVIGDAHSDETIQSRDIISYAHSDGVLAMDFKFTTDPCCFPAGTKITMADGSYKNIEDIKLGDWVKSYDIETGQTSKWMVKMLGNPIHPIVNINNGLISATVDHPFYVRKTDDREGWAAYEPECAKDAITFKGDLLTMEVGDQLYTSDGDWNEIKNIEYNLEPVQTYNILSYSGTKTYFANEVLVYEEHPPQIMTNWFLDKLDDKFPRLKEYIVSSQVFKLLFQFLP